MAADSPLSKAAFTSWTNVLASAKTEIPIGPADLICVWNAEEVRAAIARQKRGSRLCETRLKSPIKAVVS
jgi:hypothetical protein